MILDRQYDTIWHDACAAVAGAEQADAFVQMLKGAISAGGTCTTQSVKEGDSVAPGTVITLTFTAASSSGFND